MVGPPCTHAAPQSCSRCDGTSRDDWVLERAACEDAKSRVPLTREQILGLYLANREALRSAS